MDETTPDTNMFDVIAVEWRMLKRRLADMESDIAKLESRVAPVEWRMLKRRLADMESDIAKLESRVAPIDGSDARAVKPTPSTVEDDALHSTRTSAVVSVLRKMDGHFSGEVHFLTRALKESGAWDRMELKNGHGLRAFLERLAADARSPIIVDRQKPGAHHRNPAWTLSMRDHGGSSK